MASAIDIVTTSTATKDIGDHKMQMDSQGTKTDYLAIKRKKRLRKMCKFSIATVCVSLITIIVGFAGIPTSREMPYSLGGGAIAGGMALTMTICPLYMYMEEKNKIPGTKISDLFKCCVMSLTIWSCACLCVILVFFGMSGIWGMVECIKEKDNPGRSSINSCKEETTKKLLFSVLTLVLSSVLLILTILIICSFGGDMRLFGFKTEIEQQFEEYREMIRADIRQEMLEERASASRDQADGQHNIDVTNKDGNRSCRSNVEKLNLSDTNGTRDNNGHESRQHVDKEVNNEDEESPPSYDEVVKNI